MSALLHCALWGGDRLACAPESIVAMRGDGRGTTIYLDPDYWPEDGTLGRELKVADEYADLVARWEAARAGPAEIAPNIPPETS